MKQEGARDRLVMTGLVVLGLLTVVAGVASGRSTIDYVLGRDARQAALTWTAEIDARLHEPGAAQRILGENLQVLNAVEFDAMTAQQNGDVTLPANPTFRGDGVSLVDGFDRLTSGWLLRNIDEE